MTYNVFGGTLNFTQPITLVMEGGVCRTECGVRVGLFYVEQTVVFSTFHCTRSPFLSSQIWHATNSYRQHFVHVVTRNSTTVASRLEFIGGV